MSQSDLSIRQGTERIVVVDDEMGIVNTMQSILAKLGYKVTGFTDSIDALTAIRTTPNDFDVVITDYSMPQITGLEIAKHLKEAGLNIPVILTSGYLGRNLENAAQNAGITALVTKPLNTYQITDAISRILNAG